MVRALPQRMTHDLVMCLVLLYRFFVVNSHIGGVCVRVCVCVRARARVCVCVCVSVHIVNSYIGDMSLSPAGRAWRECCKHAGSLSHLTRQTRV